MRTQTQRNDPLTPPSPLLQRGEGAERGNPYLIEFDQVTIVRNGRTALDDVTFAVERSENVAIVGPNGCGKSTLVKAVARELYPFAGNGTQGKPAATRPSVVGSVKIDGLDRWNLFDLRKILGIVSNELQGLCAKEVTGLDVAVSGFFGSYGVLEPYEVSEEQRDKAREALHFMGACHLADRRTDELSSGEGRRVLIARALVNSPSALLLDEPTTSLDLRAADALIQTMRKIARHGTNIVLVTHHIEEIVPEIDRVILLKDGRIFAQGPTSEILTAENLSTLFDAPVEVEKHGDRYRAKLIHN